MRIVRAVKNEELLSGLSAEEGYYYWWGKYFSFKRVIDFWRDFRNSGVAGSLDLKEGTEGSLEVT